MAISGRQMTKLLQPGLARFLSAEEKVFKGEEEAGRGRKQFRARDK
jgi:hypothetical protein